MKKEFYLRICRNCNKQFQTKNRHDKYCFDCRYIKICQICGKEFNEKGNVICSSCREKPKIKVCIICGKEFIPPTCHKDYM